MEIILLAFSGSSNQASGCQKKAEWQSANRKKPNE